MPRSSRHKHKQAKHSSKDVKERSDSEEDGNLRSKNGGDEITVRISRDLASGEKRKIVSQSQDGNGVSPEDYVVSKRRKEGADLTDTDRWKGVEEERGKREKKDSSRADSEKSSKMKVLVDSNCTKSSRRNDNSTKGKTAGLVIESWEVQKNGSSKVVSIYKSEKDSRRKEVHQCKDGKDKERGAERESNVRDTKPEKSSDAVRGRGSVDNESGRKQGSQSANIEEVPKRKRESENDEWQVQDVVSNPELDKELEKHTRRRRDDSVDKDKYLDDISNVSNRGLSSREDRVKSGKDKGEMSDRDKYKDDRSRDKYHADVNRDQRNQDDKHRDGRSSRDHADRPDTKHFREDGKTEENRHKRSRPRDSDRDGSPHLDHRGTKYKDNKEKKRTSREYEGHSDLKSLSTNERRSDMDKKPSTGSRFSTLADNGRSQSRHDVDSSVSSTKWKTSSSSSTHYANDQYRYNLNRGSISEENIRSNIASSKERTGPPGVFDRGSERRSLEKPSQKDEKYLHELSNERSRRLDAQASPKQMIEISPSSSIDRRYSNRSNLSRSLDIEETGGRTSGSKDARDYASNERRRNRDLASEQPVSDDFTQADGDTLSGSSSLNRTSHLPGNSSSLLPPPVPPLRTGVGSPSIMDEDNRGKPSNRYRRYGDPNMGRGLGNAWKGVPSWPSPITNGFIPYPHGPPPGGFHPMMQQFPAHLFGVRPSMDFNHTGFPYHISDADRFSSHGRSYVWRNPDGPCPPQLQGWDGSNRVFGDETQMYGTADWDQNRHLMSGRGWETSTETLKGNSSVNMQLPPPVAQKEDHPQRVPLEEERSGLSDQQPQNESDCPGSCRAENIEVKQSIGAPPENASTEAPKKITNRTDDDASPFCGFYLSKLDISVDLTHPELFNNYMSIFKEKTASLNKDVTEHDYIEERTEAGVKISNAIEGVSFFPKIDESIFQRSMGLYKKQVEEVKVKRQTPFSKSEEKKVSSTEGEKLEQDPAPVEEDLKSIPTTEKEELEPVLTAEKEELDLVPTTGEAKVDRVPTTERQDIEPVPTTEKEELNSVPSPGKEELDFPTIKVEPVAVIEGEKLEPVLTLNTVEDTLEPGTAFDFEKLDASESDQDMIEVRPAFILEKLEEQIPNPNQQEAEDAVPALDQEKMGMTIPSEVAIQVEDQVTVEMKFPTSYQDEMEEESSTHDQDVPQSSAVPFKEEQEKPDPTSIQKKIDAILEKPKEVTSDDRSSRLEQLSLATADSQSTEEEIKRASDCTGNHDAEEQKTLTDAKYGSSLGFSEGSSEGCEELMPVSIECRSLGLNRMHNFPENTH